MNHSAQKTQKDPRADPGPRTLTEASRLLREHALARRESRPYPREFNAALAHQEAVEAEDALRRLDNVYGQSSAIYDVRQTDDGYEFLMPWIGPDDQEILEWSRG